MNFLPPDIALVRPSADAVQKPAAKGGRGEDIGFARALEHAGRERETAEAASERARPSREDRAAERGRESNDCAESHSACDAAEREESEVPVDAPGEETASGDETPEGGVCLDHKSDDGAPADNEAPATAKIAPEFMIAPSLFAPAANPALAASSQAPAKPEPARSAAGPLLPAPEQAMAKATPASTNMDAVDEMAKAPPAPAANLLATPFDAGKENARDAIADLILPRRSADANGLRDAPRLSFAAQAAASSLPRSLVDFTALMQASDTAAAPAASVSAIKPSIAAVMSELAGSGIGPASPAADGSSAQTLAAGAPGAIHVKAPAAEFAGAMRDIARAVPMAEIPARIAHAAADGVDRLRIVLDPPELGRVDVKITFDDGRISAALLVDRPETLDLLQRDSRALERTLNEAGFRTDSDSLDFNLRGHRHGQREGMPGHGQAPREDDRGFGDSPTGAHRMLDAAAAQAWRPHRPGGLDIRA